MSQTKPAKPTTKRKSSTSEISPLKRQKQSVTPVSSQKSKYTTVKALPAKVTPKSVVLVKPPTESASGFKASGEVDPYDFDEPGIF